MNELEFRQMFKNLSDCYADTTEYVEGKPIEGEVIQAMTEDRFIEALQQAKLLVKPAVINNEVAVCPTCGGQCYIGGTDGETRYFIPVHS